ncbi:MAG: 30S ribosomal protein S1 [Defluviitaleaceae bacterium]|nr:30S ribosomal protein S1 [Defluviitaleaceae bacterium]
MSEYKNPENSAETLNPDEQSFIKMLDESRMTLKSGEVVKGTVVGVSNTEVIVDLGFKSDGIITRAEFSDNQTEELTEQVKPGDIVEVYVLRVNDGDGNVLVSKRKVDNQLNYRQLEQAHNDKTPLTGKITDLVKGGLIANILGCRAFVPASQISGRFEQNLEQFKGKEFSFHILEYDRSKRRIVAGRKELAVNEANQRRQEVFGDLEVGQQIKGTVSRLVDFGAFIDLGGVDGLIHVSEVSWKRVRRPSEVLAVGDEITATVIAIDSEKGKISLTLKDITTNPWNGITEKYPLGEIVEGTVARLASFGAFITLEDGIDGLVHISQIADKHVNKPGDELTPGQKIQVRVMDIDLENHKISLSKREADAILYPPADDYEEEGYEEDYTNEAIAPEEEPVSEETTTEESEATEPTEADKPVEE